MNNSKVIPIDVLDLLPVLDQKLIELLKSLKSGQWQKQTIAKLWTVKDVAAHLLDGNIRVLSIFRDNYFGEQPNINSREELIDFLNGLNADWVKAMKRASPAMLIFLLELTGMPFYQYFKSVDPFGKSVLAVDWAGETESQNWMEIAREYTEKWLHQQQIRATINDTGLMTRELYYPFIDIFMLALPHTYRHVKAVNGTSIKITVSSEIGGTWVLSRVNDTWVLSKEAVETPSTTILIDPDTAWKLFSKSLRPEDISSKVQILGDQQLGETALGMVSVMA